LFLPQVLAATRPDALRALLVQTVSTGPAEAAAPIVARAEASAAPELFGDSAFA